MIFKAAVPWLFLPLLHPLPIPWGVNNGRQFLVEVQRAGISQREGATKEYL